MRKEKLGNKSVSTKLIKNNLISLTINYELYMDLGYEITLILPPLLY